jgi:peroxiredoxin
MGCESRLLFLCALCSILTVGTPAQETKAQVDLIGIDLQANDRGWKVQSMRNSTFRNCPLLDGDVIVKVAGYDVAEIGPLSIAALLEYAQLQNLAVLVERDGKEKELSLFSPASPGESEYALGQTALGATFESLEDTQRIIVTAVAPGSPAERAGLRRDDELLTVDGKGIGDLTSAQVAYHLNEIQERLVHLRIRRDAHQVEVAVKRSPEEGDSKSSTRQPLPFPLHTRGEPAPPFSLPNLEGGNISLHDFQGKPVLLTFWSTWCRPCLAEADLLDRLNREFGSRLAVLGLDVVDDPQVLQHFLQVRRLSYPVLIAGEFNSPIPKTYNLGALPLTIIINSKGFVTYLQTGFPPNSPLESQVRSTLAKSDW